MHIFLAFTLNPNQLGVGWGAHIFPLRIKISLESNMGLTTNHAVNQSFLLSMQILTNSDHGGTLEVFFSPNQPHRVHLGVHLGVHKGLYGSPEPW